MQRKRVQVDCAGKTRTQQSAANAANINTIMARYHRTGLLGSPDALNRRQAIFADVSSIGDYRVVCDRIAAAGEAFMRLPAEVRFKFRNDPSQLIEFVQNPANRDEAQRLGLIRPGLTEQGPASVLLDNTGRSDTATGNATGDATATRGGK